MKRNFHLKVGLIAFWFLFFFPFTKITTAHAATSILSGHFNDPGNPALVSYNLGVASFGSDGEIANNVALYSFSVPVAGTVSFISNGFNSGGVDPYFTLFRGNGSSATFLASNYNKSISTGGDFDLSYELPVGDYMVALGVYSNMSIAENYGSGTLSDGFTSLGVPNFLGVSNLYYYELMVSTPWPAYKIWLPLISNAHPIYQR
jgi:hypothetical protein